MDPKSSGRTSGTGSGPIRPAIDSDGEFKLSGSSERNLLQPPPPPLGPTYSLNISPSLICTEEPHCPTADSPHNKANKAICVRNTLFRTAGRQASERKQAFLRARLLYRRSVRPLYCASPQSVGRRVQKDAEYFHVTSSASCPFRSLSGGGGLP
jgi:hypothetical protein